VPAAQLVAAVDVVAERAQQLAGRFAARRAYADLGAALGDDSVEACILCLPHYLHASAARQALGAGKHVLVEKPMALSLAETDEMIAAAEQAHRVLMVGQVLRFCQVNIEARERIREGAIGRPLHWVRRRVFYHRNDPPAPWSADPVQAGGWLLYGFGSHEIDMLLWLARCGVQEVHACGQRNNPHWCDVDELAVLMRLEGGSMASLNLSLNSHSAAWDQLVVGTEGSMFVDAQGLCVNGERTAAPLDLSQAFVRQLGEFVAAIGEGRQPEASGANVRRTMAVLERIRGCM
jgi:predicted dehydrogenase